MGRVKSSLRNFVMLAGTLAAVVCFENCGGSGGSAGSTSSDWYFHWNCHGDAQCLSTNSAGTASGNLDEGPDQVNCTQLMTFAQHFWGAGATYSCDQIAGGGGSTTPITENVLPVMSPVNTYWTCTGSSPYYLFLTESAPGTGTGVFQKLTSPPSEIAAFNWVEGTDEESINVTTVGPPDIGLIQNFTQITPNFTPNPTIFKYLHDAYACTLTNGTLPAVPQDLTGGFISQAGLTWMPNATDGAQTWSAANTYCTTSTINGSSGWRLPTFAELHAVMESGATTTSYAYNNTWAPVSSGGGANPTWTADAAGAGFHKAIGQLSLTGSTASDSTLYQVTCVK